ILAARAETGDGTPGFALDENLLIACGNGALRLTRLQREGKRPADAVDFLRGRAVDKGTVFE
ncbi:MAG: methionyl-tRNA formyltransferase, partial [Pseudomonadota bacterium]|nr:methionyl-tRNA formyltransferase [Pseudomonadota bacterium]